MTSQKFGNEILQASFLYPFDTYSSLCDFFFKTESKQKKKCLLDEKRSKEIGYFPFFEIHMLRPYILQ